MSKTAAELREEWKDLPKSNLMSYTKVELVQMLVQADETVHGLQKEIDRLLCKLAGVKIGRDGDLGYSVVSELKKEIEVLGKDIADRDAVIEDNKATINEYMREDARLRGELAVCKSERVAALVTLRNLCTVMCSVCPHKTGSVQGG